MTTSHRLRHVTWLICGVLLLSGCTSGKTLSSQKPPAPADPPADSSAPPPGRAEKAIYCDPMLPAGHYLR
jgi:hypothetical protein